ncbi:SusC/RagA family TonB-linked outer membrane protein [Adhaeribacter aerolatus]|uniref:SusC/RagA family TonB-linked outer membrane protein n=2 Tax=Adhaeribacter aerolatus TaxID=670289 RepID=A0A512B001_9BACT|nr:SusC/RagA family TonB-linked outer membrane protein [Adhaeribacter aerolatus]
MMVMGTSSVAFPYHPASTLKVKAVVWPITGKVVDATGNPLPGVTVVLKGTTNGTSTGVDGSFSLSVPEAAGVLAFSFIGYTPQEKAFTGPGTMNITLAEDAKALEEVVVVGYGTQQRKDVTGSVAQVTAKEFNSGVNPNPLQAIQGKVAGLVITQPNGDPNQNPTIRLRGYTSLAGGSDPLYVVDGIIGVPINSIAPADIETMDVLKDASAAAIYGSRAANGVIIITTKRGKAGTTSVSFNNYVAADVISSELDLLDAEGYRAQVAKIKGDASLNDVIRFPKDANGQGYNTDWFDQITRTGFTNNHDLSIMGGSEAFTYRGSLNYIKRDGIVKNTGFGRLTGRVNLDQKALNNRLNVQYSLAYTQTDQQNRNDDVITRATFFLPTLPIRNTDGSYYEIPGSNALYNPVAMLENYQNDDLKRVMIGGINLKYELLDGFVIGVNGALKNDNTVNSQAYNRNVLAFRSNQGRTSRNLYQTNNKLLEITGSYTRQLGGTNNFNILGGYSYQDNVDDGFGAYNNNYINGLYEQFGYNNLSGGRGTLLSGAQDYATSYRNRTTLVSFFGRGTLNLMDKYNLTATVRQDGSSKFGANNKWAIFPSFAAGWTISNEGFLQGNKPLSYLKLRAGWGQTGNSEGISPYQSLFLYGRQGTYYDGSIGDFVPGYAVIQNSNPDLKWEIIQQANVGIDFTLFEQLNGTIDVYDKRTKDMLYNYNVPANGQYFVNTITANVGEMSNKGIELSLSTDIIKTENLTWNTRLVGTAYKNEIVSLKNDQFDVGVIRYNEFGGRGLSDVFASQLREGHPLGEFLIPHFAGFGTDGKVLLEGADGTTTTDYTKAKLYEAGVAQPRLSASFINSFQYGNFDLNFQLRGVFGNKILNNLRSNFTIPGSILEGNQLTDIANYQTNYSTNQLSDLWLEDGSFVRLDNWQIGYNVPPMGVFKNARVYLGGNNLFIITKYKGIDPELEVRGDLRTSGDAANRQRPNTLGLDNTGIYPKTRSFQLGVNLTF